MAVEGMDHLRVMTFNVLGPMHADWGRRREVGRAGLRELRPDVVALQEVTRTEGYDQVLDLLGPGYTVVDHPEPSPEGVGAAMASRWPVRDARRLDLGSTAGSTNASSRRSPPPGSSSRLTASSATASGSFRWCCWATSTPPRTRPASACGPAG